MLLLLSPAKSLDYSSQSLCKDFTLPHFTKETKQLSDALKKLKAADLKKMMSISDKLSELNYQRFQGFSNKFDSKNSKQAILAFDGDVYAPIEREKFTKKDFDYTQKHLRILSGFYGLLKPLDLMQPYRLEMGTDLRKSILEKTLDVKNLYEFWGDKISNYLNESKASELVNLASEEYFSAINPNKISAQIINIIFKEKKDGKLKIIGINAKKARGLMVNFAIKNKITSAKDLKEFSEEKYKFNPKLSDKTNWVFVR